MTGNQIRSQRFRTGGRDLPNRIPERNLCDRQSWFRGAVRVVPPIENLVRNRAEVFERDCSSRVSFNGFAECDNISSRV